jgi:hypothetical protein
MIMGGNEPLTLAEVQAYLASMRPPMIMGGNRRYSVLRASRFRLQ